MRLETAPTGAMKVEFKALSTSYLLHRTHVTIGIVYQSGRLYF
jgi:hypothetical protein